MHPVTSLASITVPSVVTVMLPEGVSVVPAGTPVFDGPGNAPLGAGGAASVTVPASGSGEPTSLDDDAATRSSVMLAQSLTVLPLTTTRTKRADRGAKE